MQPSFCRFSTFFPSLSLHTRPTESHTRLATTAARPEHARLHHTRMRFIHCADIHDLPLTHHTLPFYPTTTQASFLPLAPPSLPPLSCLHPCRDPSKPRSLSPNHGPPCPRGGRRWSPTPATASAVLPSNDGRPRLSELARALQDFYGCSLTSIGLRYRKRSSAARLVALLHRQKKLDAVCVGEQKNIPAFSQAIAQGCCRGIKKLYLYFEDGALTHERLKLLVGAFEVDGALAGLTTLHLR